MKASVAGLAFLVSMDIQYLTQEASLYEHHSGTVMTSVV